MALDRIVSMVLRAAELAFAAIVAGVNGYYLDKAGGTAWQQGRFIYTEVVAGLSIFLAIVRLFPFASGFISWPLDLVVSTMWWAAFGLLVDLLGNTCGGIFNWNNIAVLHGDPCGKFKAVIAFSFLSALLWLVSALVGFFWVRSRERRAARVDAAHHHHHHHRRWYRRSRV